MKKIAVFCSGFGSNLQAIIEAVKKGKIKAEISLVVSDKAESFALVRAKRAGIPVLYAANSDFKNRIDDDKFIARSLKQRKIDLVVLAGYMRLLSPEFVRQFKNKILNIHPSLLPSFKGSEGLKDALEYGVKVTGVTVHFVDEALDHGPVILQKAVEIKDKDTQGALARRLHKTEHRLYPKAIKLFVEGKLIIKGRKVLVRK